MRTQPNIKTVTTLELIVVIFAGISALMLTVGIARFAYTPMLPLMTDQARLTPVQGGWLATVNYAGYMAGTILIASMSDMGKKFLLYRIGLIFAIFSTVAMGLTQNQYFWGALRFIAGLSSTAGLLLASGLILNWLQSKGKRPALGLHFSGMGLGIALSGLVVIASVRWLDWESQWLLLGAVGVVAFIPAWFGLPAPDLDRHPPKSVIKSQAHQTYAIDQSSKSEKIWMTLMASAYFCAGFGFVIGATYIVSFLEKLPILAGQGGWIWVLVGTAAIPSAIVWDRIARLVGENRSLILAYALQLISILIPALSSHVSANLFAAALFGATFVGIVSLTLTLVGNHFPKAPAKAMARITIGYGGAQMIAPAMAGYIAKVTGSYKGAFIVTTIVMFFGLLILWLLNNIESKNIHPGHQDTWN